jgi:flagellar protein FlaJ
MSYDFDRLTSGGFEEDDVAVETGFGKSVYGALAEAFHSVYLLIFGGRDWTNRFEDKLAAANISTTADLWLSGAFAIGCIVGGAVSLFSILLAFFGVLPVFAPTFTLGYLPAPEFFNSAVGLLGAFLGVMVYAGFGAGVGVIVGGGIAVLIPYLRAWKRGRQIKLVKPDAVSFMYSLSMSGMGQMDVFRATAKAEDQYGEFSVEFKRIVHQVDHLNSDFRSAVENVASTTPNDDMAKFLTGMISTLGSGGSLDTYLENAQRRERESRKQQLETIVDYMRAFGQAYMTLMIAPMLMVIMLVLMAAIGSRRMVLLFATVYFIIPVLNIIYALLISSVKIDEVGDGYMRNEDDSIAGKTSNNPFEFATVEKYLGEDPVFRQIQQKEAERRIINYVINNPFGFFIQYPKYLFMITVPVALLGWGVLYTLGLFTPTYEAITTQPLTQTLTWFFWPIFVTLLPFSLFYEYREHARSGIMDTLSEDLLKLAEINKQGQPLPEAMREVAAGSQSKLSKEFGIMYKKLQMGTPMTHSLKEMNNKYKIPRLARQLKILEQAQEVSTHITQVLQTVAETAEYQQRIEEKRQSKMKLQVYIIEGAFIVFLLIMAGMDAAVVDVISGLVDGGNDVISDGDPVDPTILTMVFIHAALVQGFCSGILSGYVKTSDLARGVKLALFNAVLVLVTWLALPYVKPMVL